MREKPVQTAEDKQVDGKNKTNAQTSSSVLTMTKAQASESPTIDNTSKVSGSLNGVLYAAVQYAMRTTELDSVTVTAISNGDHSKDGGHYDKPVANAVDIGAINGVPIREGQPLAQAFFGAMTKFLDAQGGAKAAYSPDALLERGKSGKLAPVEEGARADKLASQHTTHQHYSVIPGASNRTGPKIQLVE
jgi:hypothetical protein